MHIRRETCAFVLLLVAAAARATASQEVTLSLDDYESLRQRAQAPSAIVLTPLVPIVLESADVVLDVGDARARFSVELAIVIYDDGWQSIPLPADGRLTAVELGTLDGRLSSPHSEGAGPGRVLICRGQGRHVVRLEGVVPVGVDDDAARPRRSVKLGLPAAGIVTGLVRSERDGDELVFRSGAIVRIEDALGTRSFVGEPGSDLEVEFVGARPPPASTLPLTFEASSVAMASVSRNGLGVSGVLRVDILQGEMERLRVGVPPGMKVVDVTSDAEATLGWDHDADVVDLRWAAPVSDVVDLTFELTRSGELPDLAEGLEAPLLVSDGAARSIVMTGVGVEGDGVATWTELGSARRASARDKARLPEIPVDASAVFVVQDPDRPPRWRVDWAGADAGASLAAQVDRLIVDVLIGESGDVAYQYWAVVRSPGALSLAVRPPPGFELVEAVNGTRRVVAGRSDGGIEVPLTATAESQVVYLLGLSTLPLPDGKGRLEIPLPSLSAPAASVDVRAVLPGERRYRIEPEGLVSSLRPLPETSADAELGLEAERSRPTWLTPPAGYDVLTASWSALSEAPRSLSIRSEVKRAKRRWQ